MSWDHELIRSLLDHGFDIEIVHILLAIGREAGFHGRAGVSVPAANLDLLALKRDSGKWTIFFNCLDGDRLSGN